MKFLKMIVCVSKKGKLIPFCGNYILKYKKKSRFKLFNFSKITITPGENLFQLSRRKPGIF